MMQNLGSVSVVTIIAIMYWIIDFYVMTKYLDQIKSIWRSRRVVGSSRKYFVKAVLREFACIVYSLSIMNMIFLSLSIFALVFNLIVLALMIIFKKVTYKNRNWEDKAYDWVAINMLNRKLYTRYDR